MHRIKSSNLIFVGFITLVPFVLFWQWLIKGRVLYWGTLLLQFWPWHQLVKTSLLHGQWPLWNPLLGNGTPLLANLQSAVFYPPNLLYLIVPVEHGLTLSILLHLVLAGLLMYVYTRHLGFLPFAATVSALAYMLSGYIIGRNQFVSMVNAAAWFPLLLFLSDKLINRRKPIYIAGLAIAFANQLLAGHAQLWFYGLWLVGAYLIFRSYQQTSQHLTKLSFFDILRPIFKNIGLLALSVCLSLFIAAIQILPTAEFVVQSARSSGAERAFALTYSYWPWRFITLLMPDFFGHPAQGTYWGYANYWEDHAYIGVLPLILALVAIWHYLKERFWKNHQTISKDNTSPQLPQPLQIIPFFALLIPVSLLLALGQNTPIYLWVYDTIPGFSFFQAPARLLIWYTVAVAVLAGVGAQHFQSTPENRPNWRRLLAACIALTAVGFLGTSALTGRALAFLNATQSAGILLIISIILLLIRPEKAEREPLWQGVVILFIGIDLLLAAWPLLPMHSSAIYTKPITSAQAIKNQSNHHRFFVDDQFAYATIFYQYFQFKSFGPPDIEHNLDLKETLAPNFGVYANLPSVNNNDPLRVGHWERLVNELKQADKRQQSRLLSLMGAGYLINTVVDEPLPTIYTTDYFSIQAVPDVLPRAYFVSQPYIAQSNQQVIDRLRNPNFDPHQEVVIIQDEANKLINTSTSSVDFIPVSVQNSEAGQVQLTVSAPTPGFVVLTDTYYFGWQAEVNGQPAKILLANLAFRAVAIEAGQHTIDFYYRPLSFTFGLWTSIITCLIITGWLCVRISFRFHKK